jgi:outer membrane lipoprotein-sorting protein
MKQAAYVRLAIFIVLALGMSSAWAQMPQPFSGDMTITPKTGEKMTGKLYVSPPNNRMDMTTPPGKGGPMGGRVSMITDGTTQTSYMVMHEQKMYMEMHLNQLANQTAPMMGHASKAPSAFDPNHPCRPEATCKKVGTEMVNGRVCDKWVTTDKSGTHTAWIDQKLWYPIKAQSSSGETFELTNVKEGAQPASLFQPPAGYRKMDLGSMMGGQRPH